MWEFNNPLASNYILIFCTFTIEDVIIMFYHPLSWRHLIIKCSTKLHHYHPVCVYSAEDILNVDIILLGKCFFRFISTKHPACLQYFSRINLKISERLFQTVNYCISNIPTINQLYRSAFILLIYMLTNSRLMFCPCRNQ